MRFFYAASNDFYGLMNFEVTILSGNTTACTNISTLSDTNLEDPKIFLVTLGVLDSSVTVIGQHSVQVKIISDDGKSSYVLLSIYLPLLQLHSLL